MQATWECRFLEEWMQLLYTSVIPVCLHLGIGRQRQKNCLQLMGQLVTYEVVNKRDPVSNKVEGKDQIQCCLLASMDMPELS